MAVVTFYEKPGCGTNARQKAALEAAGHALVVRSLIAEPWTPEALAEFLRGTPVASWINPASPRVKSGEVDPGRLDAAAAMSLMVADHVLIRRPLLEAEGVKAQGFDSPLAVALVRGDTDGLVACRRPAAAGACRTSQGSSVP